jgi:myo-inositol-1(or 4)-monophosphatase
MADTIDEDHGDHHAGRHVRSGPAHLAVRLAREAALMIRTAGRPRRVHRLKSSAFDVLTATDLAVERRVRRRLAAAHPDWPIVGEEGGGVEHLDLNRTTWFVDPVDGTTNFVHGLPLVACNIALWSQQDLSCAATADVFRLRTYRVERGRGAWVGRRRLAVSDTRSLTRAVLSTGFPPYRAEDDDNNLAEFATLIRQVRDVRRIGAAGLDLAWVAAGMLDGYWEQGDGPWDWAAGALLVREAGGRVTTYDGAEWKPGEPTLVASNGHLHDLMLDRIQRARAGRAPVRSRFTTSG